MPGSPSPVGRKPGVCQTGQLVTREGREGSNPSPGAFHHSAVRTDKSNVATAFLKDEMKNIENGGGNREQDNLQHLLSPKLYLYIPYADGCREP